MTPPAVCPGCSQPLLPSLGGVCPRCLAKDLEADPPVSHLPDEAAAGEPFGKYRKVRKLGAGGMGEVWKAWDVPLRRWVALKFLKGDETDLPRFLREGRTAAGLIHPNIAVVYESGEIDGRHYIALQYVHGVTLENFPRKDRPLLVRLMRDVARAVEHAHGQGVIHRDLKPANLMVEHEETGSSHVVVMDFGLARPLETGHTLSVSGVVLGTPAYMSPEQARGEPAGPRSDVYALGATLYDLLVHRPPFVGRNLPELLDKLQKEEPRPPRDLDPRVDRDLETIALKCLEKDPARRYDSARAVADDLDRYLRGDTIQARPAGLLYKAGKFGRRHSLSLSLAATVVLTGGYSLFVALWPGRLDLDSTPPGATIRIDGRDTGRRTPATLTLWPPGSHLIEVTKEGFERLPIDVVAQAGQRARRSATLVRMTGTLTVHTTPKDVLVEVEADGVRRSLGPAPIDALDLPRGVHRLILTQEGYDEAQRIVVVRPGEDTRVDASLEVSTGRLQITGNVDGFSARLQPVSREEQLPQVIPAPSIDFATPTGRYLVTFEKENHHGQSVDLDLKKGMIARLHATLTPMLMWSHGQEINPQHSPRIKAGKMIPADCDGDGILDVLTIHQGGAAALSGRNGALLWEHKSVVAVNLPATLADLDGDGTLELLLAGPSAIVALSMRDGSIIWRCPTAGTDPGDTIEGPIIADLNGDSILDCLVGSRPGGVQAVSGINGSRLWVKPDQNIVTYPPGTVQVRPQNDGTNSAVYPAGFGQLRFVSARDGSLLREFKVSRDHGYRLRVVGDLNTDGIEDYIIFHSGVRAVSGADGAELWASMDLLTVSDLQHPSMDVNGDGTPDFAIYTLSHVSMISGKDGKRLWSNPIDGLDGFVIQPSIDLEGDGLPDFVSNQKGKLRAYSAKNGNVLWSFDSGKDQPLGITLGHASVDGTTECIVATPDGRVLVLSGREGKLLWRYRAPGGLHYVPPILCDLNGDGTNDIALWGDAGVLALSGRHAPVVWEHSVDDEISGPVLSADMDGDGIQDCVVSIPGTRPLRVLSGTDGMVLRCLDVEPGLHLPIASGPADFDKDGIPDWIVADNTSRAFAVSGKTAQVMWKASVSGAIGRTVTADFNGDGFDDCLIPAWASSKGLALIDGRTGKKLWTSDIGGVTAVPAVADFDKDGLPDVLIRSSGLRALSGKDGSPIWTGRTRGISDCFPHPVPMDVDGDGIPDLISSRLPEAHSGKTGTILWQVSKGHESGALAPIGDVNGDGIPDVASLTGDKRGLRLCTLSGKDGSVIYEIIPPELPILLCRPEETVPFSPHLHSDVMSRGWRLQVLTADPPGDWAVVVLETHVLLLERRSGRVLAQFRGVPPMSVALAAPAGKDPPALYVGADRTVRRIQMSDQGPEPPIDSESLTMYPAGLPPILAAIRQELRGFTDGRTVPEMCERLLRTETSPPLRRILLSRRAEYLFLLNKHEAMVETLDQLSKEGGDSYFPHLVRYLGRRSTDELLQALLRDPVETSRLMSIRATSQASTSSELPDLLLRLEGTTPDAKLARVGACLVTGEPGLAAEYLHLAQGNKPSEIHLRLKQLIPVASRREPDILNFTRTIVSELLELSPEMRSGLANSDIAETALLGMRACLSRSKPDKAAVLLERALKDPALPGNWDPVLEHLLYRVKGN